MQHSLLNELGAFYLPHIVPYLFYYIYSVGFLIIYSPSFFCFFFFHTDLTARTYTTLFMFLCDTYFFHEIQTWHDRGSFIIK
jgi:hypothetical protein